MGELESTIRNTAPSFESDNQQQLLNTFQLLPDDIIGEIFGHINSIELIFSLSRVCKCWRSISGQFISRDYEKLVSELKLDLTTTGERNYDDDFNGFLKSLSGRRFVKYLLRKQVYKLACEISSSTRNMKEQLATRTMVATGEWIDLEIAILKQYFNEFSECKEPKLKVATKQNEGFFGSAMSFVGSFFSTNQKSNSSTTSANVQPADYDVLTKVQMGGYHGSGKTSFIDCAMNHTTVTDHQSFSTIGMEFVVRTLHFGRTTRVKVQLWDQIGMQRFRSTTQLYYRGVSTILFLIDPYSTFNKLESETQQIKTFTPDAEVIVITTMKDKQSDQSLTRVVNNSDLQLFAYQEFGGAFHLDITNTKVDEPKSIVCYSALMKYLLSPTANSASSIH